MSGGENEMGSPERKSFQSEYEKALDSLSSLITRRIRADGMNKGDQFDLMLDYLKILELEEPISKMKVIHVAGTKGKGSTCTFTESILRNCGFHTGLFTSPHLIDVRERFKLDGVEICEEKFLAYFWWCWDKLKDKTNEDVPMPTYFRFLVLLGFKIFAEEQVDVAILEVGLGGKFDATNVVQSPIVCGISSLGYDHMEILGNTLGEIAGQKAGIFKHGVPAFTVPQPQEAMSALEYRASQLGITLQVATPLDIRLLNGQQLGLDGEHQYLNAGLAIALCYTWLQRTGQTEGIYFEQTRSLPEQFVRGLATASLQGRAQIVPDPYVNLQHKCDANLQGLVFFLDGAHSPESMEMCARWFSHAVKEDIQQHNSFKQLSHDSQSSTHGLIQSHTNEGNFPDFSVRNTTQILLFNCMPVRDPQLLLPPLRKACARHVSRFKCWFQSATGDMHKENLQPGISVLEESGPSTRLDIQSSGKHPQSNAEDHHTTVTPFKWLKYCIWFLLKYLFIIVRFECINVIIAKKRKHALAFRTVDKLLQYSTPWAYDNDGMNPKDTILEVDSHLDDEHVNEMEDRGSPPDVGNQQKKGPIKIYKGSQNVLLEFDGTPLKVVVTILGEDKGPEGMMVRGLPRSLSHGNDNAQEHVDEGIEGAGCPLVKYLGQDKSLEEKMDRLNITPFLLAVENGVIEMVQRILDRVPSAIYDQKPSDKKNALLLAIQKRQIDIYDFLRTKFKGRSEIFGKVDKNGDNALHIAASGAKQGPQLIPGDAMRMLWEMKWYQVQWQTKWYEYVKDSMPGYFFETHNESQKTPQEVFTDTLKHQLVNKDGDRWLEATSGACSVVASLIATVAFASATTVPGDYANDGVPTLHRHNAFRIYIISSFLALCFSLTSIITFLNILISGFQKSDYSKSLGHKLLVGLTSLYLSLGSMLVSFFASHVLILKGKTKHWCLPIYALGLLPVIIISVMQVNLFFNLLHCVFGRRPQPSYRGFSL